MLFNFRIRVINFLLKIVNKIHSNTGKASVTVRKYKFFLEFEERDDDIYITSFLKSGTTWMQMILHQLVGKGGADFDHIYDVSPWVHNEAYLGKTPERVNNLPSPRLIKTHDPYERFDSKVKGKFIYVYRNGKDLAVSLYYHIKYYENPDITFEENFEKYFLEDKYNWFIFNQKWFNNENNFPVHFVSYESLSHDFDNTIQGIADFLEVGLTSEKMEKIKHYTSFDFMKKHESKFGERAQKIDKRIFNKFIRKGKTGEGKKYLSEKQEKDFDMRYAVLKPLLENKISTKKTTT